MAQRLPYIRRGQGSRPLPKMSEPICAGGVTESTAAVQVAGGGSSPAPALQLSQLTFGSCDKHTAVEFVRAHHSRLSKCQESPWKFAFAATSPAGQIVAVALWNNPSARTLPGHWLELRRLAASPLAPRNTCSCFLAWMVRLFKKSCPQHEKCISYQDLDVHTGTIYKAAGWVVEYTSKRRTRDRSKPRKGTDRAYRSNLNGVLIDSAPKARWATLLTK